MLLICLSTALALTHPIAVRQGIRRAAPPAMEEKEAQCMLVELTANEPKRVAQVLRKAWMEGGVKRGLTGTVLVPADGKVQIVCQGELARLKSFAEWIETESMLVEKVSISDVDACPTVPMTSRFPFADAEDEDAQPWRELLESISIEIGAAKGTTQSNDEGLF